MKNKITYTIIFLVAISRFSMASPAPPPPDEGGGPGCWPPPCIPIDGGISLLIAAGALYGGRKIYKKSLIKKHS